MPAKGPETVEVNSTTLYPSNGPDIYPPNLYFKFNAKYSVIIDTSNQKQEFRFFLESISLNMR